MWTDNQIIPHERSTYHRKDEYRPDIDGLRCIAVMLVLLFHFDLPNGFRAGFIGVDIFFVISGFLIIPPMVAELEAGRFSFKGFYERRIRRLAPALLVTTLITFGVALLALTPIEMVAFAKEAIAAQLYVSNIYYWRYLNYFGLLANQSYLLHTWSLAVEEQFYLTFPFALWATAKFLRRRLLLALAIIGGASFALNVLTLEWKPEATFYLLPTRAWEFAAGAFAPQLIKFGARRGLPITCFILSGMASLVLALIIYRPTTPVPGWYALLPVLGTVLLLVGGTQRQGRYYRVISSLVPRYLGRISYELYLVHWPIKILTPLIIAEIGYSVRLAELLLTVLLAACIYHFIEAPIRTRRAVKSGRSLATAYVASTVVIVATLAFTVLSRGLPQRFTPQVVALARGAEDFDESFRGCEGNLQRPCLIGRKRVQPTWLIYGDSHADALAGAFSSYFDKRGQAAYFSFQSGCLPISNANDAQCRSYNDNIEAFVGRRSQITNVVIVSSWMIKDGFVDDQNEYVKGKAAVAAFNRSLNKTLEAFGGRRVTIWLPVPGAMAPVPGTLARNLMWGRQWDLRVPLTRYAENDSHLRSALLQHPEVTTIDPGLRLCRTDKCDVTYQGRSLYYDNGHPAASQRFFYEKIIKEDLDRIMFNAPER